MFSVTAAAAGSSIPVDFDDVPIVKEVVDNAADNLPTTFQNGVITIQPGFEGDVSPRPFGSGAVTILDWVQVGRFAAGLDVPSPSEFQRVDCAPRTSNGSLVLGGGTISIADWVQAGRYAAGLDPLTPEGGPAGPNLIAGAAVSEQFDPAEQLTVAEEAAIASVAALEPTLRVSQAALSQARLV